jgi:hypothetical protein
MLLAHIAQQNADFAAAEAATAAAEAAAAANLKAAVAAAEAAAAKLKARIKELEAEKRMTTDRPPGPSTPQLATSAEFLLYRRRIIFGCPASP